MFKGYARAAATYDNAMPEDNECGLCVAGECEYHEVYELENRLDDLGYDIEKLKGVGITVLRKGKFKFFGTEDEIMEWLTENGEA